jgi:hypothetical protein
MTYISPASKCLVLQLAVASDVYIATAANLVGPRSVSAFFPLATENPDFSPEAGASNLYRNLLEDPSSMAQGNAYNELLLE